MPCPSCSCSSYRCIPSCAAWPHTSVEGRPELAVAIIPAWPQAGLMGMCICPCHLWAERSCSRASSTHKQVSASCTSLILHLCKCPVARAKAKEEGRMAAALAAREAGRWRCRCCVWSPAALCLVTSASARSRPFLCLTFPFSRVDLFLPAHSPSS